MKKLFAIVLSVLMIMTFMPTSAFAAVEGYDCVTLEFVFDDGLSDGCVFNNGSDFVKIAKVYWQGDDNSKREYVTDPSLLKINYVYGEANCLTLSKGEDDSIVFTSPEAPTNEIHAMLEYVGEDKDILDYNGLFCYFMSESQQNVFSKLTIKSSKVKASTSGNTLTWTPSSTKVNPDFYYIYRSTSKTKGYKQIATVKGNIKKYVDNANMKKGTKYFYKVCAASYKEGEIVKTKMSTPVSCKALKKFVANVNLNNGFSLYQCHPSQKINWDNAGNFAELHKGDTQKLFAVKENENGGVCYNNTGFQPVFFEVTDADGYYANDAFKFEKKNGNLIMTVLADSGEYFINYRNGGQLIREIRIVVLEQEQEQ